MPDKVSFTNFGEKKKVRRVKRKRVNKSGLDKEELLKEILAAKKDADKTIRKAQGVSFFQFPFLEVSVFQTIPSVVNDWTLLEVRVINSGNGIARSISISFDNLETRGKTFVDSLNFEEEIILNFEVKTISNTKQISRMDLYYHSVEGDTFSVVRRDWFPNDYESLNIFMSEIPPGEEDKSDLYAHREVITEDFHVVCSKCSARAPSNFRICGKCGSRLQKRVDRRDDWGSNLSDTTAIKDEREVLLEKLRKLGELKDKGLLSEDEFSAAKIQFLE